MEASAWQGWLVLILFAVALVGISTLVARRFGTDDVDGLVVAGRALPFGLVSASVFVAWVWTTTLLGAAEAGFWFGISGGLNYAWGAAFPFFIFIPLALRMRRVMPRTTTFVEYMRERFNDTFAKVYVVFGVLLVAYVCVEQSVGLGYVMQYSFGMNYKLMALIMSLLFASFIAIAGLRGSVYNSVFQFFVIVVVVFVAMPIILAKLGLGDIYAGMKDVATNPDNPNYNEDALNILSFQGFRYGLVGFAVAIGQIILSQGYYSAALAAVNSRTLKWAYLIGTVLAWIPIPIIFGNVIGGGALSIGLDTEAEEVVRTGITPYIFSEYLGLGGVIMLAILVLMAGLTTGGNGLAGLQAIFSVDLYKKYLKRDASEKQQTTFGKWAVLACGVLIGVGAILLEGRSLLNIDIFSGILFAAPCAPLVVGLYSRRLTVGLSAVAVPIGLIGGLIAYFAIDNEDWNFFIANAISLVVPFLVIFVGLPFSRHEFDFDKLRNYVSEHRVVLHEDDTPAQPAVATEGGEA